METDSSCKSCKSISGEERISPGPVVYTGKYWVIEHVKSVRIRGWLILVLKRHATAIHELTNDEYIEWMELTKKTCQILKNILNCEKEYVMTICEAEGFDHLHTHIIPRVSGMPEEYKGTKVFSLLKEDPGSDQDIIDACDILIPFFNPKK